MAIDDWLSSTEGKGLASSSRPGGQKRSEFTAKENYKEWTHFQDCRKTYTFLLHRRKYRGRDCKERGENFRPSTALHTADSNSPYEVPNG